MQVWYPPLQPSPLQIWGRCGTSAKDLARLECEICLLVRMPLALGEGKGINACSVQPDSQPKEKPLLGSLPHLLLDLKGHFTEDKAG